MTVGAQVVVVVVVVLHFLLQDVVEVAVIDGVASSTADLAVDAGEAVSSRLAAVAGASVAGPGGPTSAAGSGSRACLGLRPRGSPGGQEEHTGRRTGGEEL